ncbi:MAG: M81 family peptidase [Mesorhizobium sp.]|uniref:M81 family metallopeptidase n=1 Tax=Mesorhizobium sp. TaxID=1871066 RepID=UPI000FE4B3AA|nr:MAG: M81 family peptidase [Mesorhizobium sp.]
MATLSTETNTFSPVPTGLRNYEDYFLRHGTATQDPPNLMTEALHVWRSRGAARDWTITESLSAIAEPAGRTTRAAYAALKEEILRDLRAACPVDIVLLQLHGAMAAEGCDDCEADVVAAVRAICPEAIIGVALDCHCHLTDALLSQADLVICFKEYPHDDASARAEELFDLALRAHDGEISPVMALFDCRMVSLFLTKQGAMLDFVAKMKATEMEPGILSVSLGHGFPWADLPDAGARMLVVADSDMALARGTAVRLGRAFFDLRHHLVPNYPDLQTGLDRARAALSGPVVLADMSDNPGGGAPGDAVHVLRELLAQGVTNVASGLYWDPMAVRQCENAGEGAEIQLRLGGKTEPASGQPLDISGRIMRIISGLGQHLGAGLEPLGTMVWLKMPGDIDLVINDLRTQVYHPEAFEQLGVRLAKKRLIVVKSLFHFYGPFSAIASEIIFCATPGRVNPNTGLIPFTRRDMNFWPRIGDPFAQAGKPAGAASVSKLNRLEDSR